MLNWIDKLTDTIQEYDKGILDNPKISNPENELLRYLKYYKNRLLEHLDCLRKQKTIRAFLNYAIKQDFY